MNRVALVWCLVPLLGCPPSHTNEKPAGTPNDPVQVCEQAGDVCQAKGSSKLGVCNTTTAGCPGPEACFTCAPQH